MVDFKYKGLDVAWAPRVAISPAAVMVNATTIFTILNGMIEVLQLVSRCVTANNGTASTLRWSCDPTGSPSAATFSGASASLASAAVGTNVVLNMTALDTALDIVVGGVGLGAVQTRRILLPPGIITTTIGVGSTTGTWKHLLLYRPLDSGAAVAPE